MVYSGRGDPQNSEVGLKRLGPVFLDSIFISFHATDKQVKRAPSLRWEPSSSSLGAVCSLGASIARGLIPVPLRT